VASDYGARMRAAHDVLSFLQYRILTGAGKTYMPVTDRQREALPQIQAKMVHLSGWWYYQ
jgi:hypothetical protein